MPRQIGLVFDNKLSGAIIEPSAYFKKSPPVQFTDEEARRMVEEYITKYGWKHAAKAEKPMRAAAKTPATTKTARPATTKTPKRVVTKNK